MPSICPCGFTHSSLHCYRNSLRSGDFTDTGIQLWAENTKTEGLERRLKRKVYESMQAEVVSAYSGNTCRLGVWLRFGFWCSSGDVGFDDIDLRSQIILVITLLSLKSIHYNILVNWSCVCGVL